MKEVYEMGYKELKKNKINKENVKIFNALLQSLTRRMSIENEKYRNTRLEFKLRDDILVAEATILNIDEEKQKEIWGK